MTSTRVLQWATGATGMHALRAVIENDELGLAGVRVYDDAKAGRDAGDLAGTAPTGITATADRAEAIDIDADVVLYMARSEYDLPRQPRRCRRTAPAWTRRDHDRQLVHRHPTLRA